MHPLIARYLALPAAITSLEKENTEQTLDTDEAAFISAAAKLPKARAAILKAKGAKAPSQDTQQQLIVLAVRAASSRLQLDPVLGPRVDTARDALVKEGATPDEAEDLIAQAVLEEAFGYAEDPDTFDRDFLAETLESLAHLAPVTQDSLDAWLEDFARSGATGDRALRLKVAETLLESAWSEGPQPITPEHLDDALEHLSDSVAESERSKAIETLREFLEGLSRRQIVGKERLKRLEQLLDGAARGGMDPEPLEDELEDDDD